MDLSDRVEPAAKAIGARHWARGDISSGADVARMVGDAAAALGGLYCLVDVAGLQVVGRVTETTVEDWDRLMAVNLRGTFLMCRAAVDHLRRSARGAIINTAFIAGQRGGPGSTAYSASKGGVIAFGTELALALELAPDGITVNTVCPGWVDTGFNAPVIALPGGQYGPRRIDAGRRPLGRRGPLSTRRRPICSPPPPAPATSRRRPSAWTAASTTRALPGRDRIRKARYDPTQCDDRPGRRDGPADRRCRRPAGSTQSPWPARGPVA